MKLFLRIVDNSFELHLPSVSPDVKVPKGICVTSVGTGDLYAYATANLEELRKVANSLKGTDEERRENLEKSCKA